MKKNSMVKTLVLCALLIAVSYAGSLTVVTDTIAYRHQETVTIGTQLLGVGFNCYPGGAAADSVLRKGDRLRFNFKWRRQGGTVFLDTTIIINIKSDGIDSINNGRGYGPYLQHGTLPK